MERIKLKCPTCWAETYVVVDGPEDETARIFAVSSPGHLSRGHGDPTVMRRETLSGEEEANVRTWRAAGQDDPS